MTLALLFDLDGTLVDTDHLHHGAFRAILAERGRALSLADYRAHIMGHPNDAILARFFPGEDMAVLEQLRHVRLTLLFTYSGITDPRVEPVAKSDITVSSITRACEEKDRTKVVLYWRPIVPGWNDAPETMHPPETSDEIA